MIIIPDHYLNPGDFLFRERVVIKTVYPSALVMSCGIAVCRSSIGISELHEAKGCPPSLISVSSSVDLIA